MTNQTFNMHRFNLVLKKELIENKRQILITILCLFLGLTLVMILGNLITSVSGEGSDMVTKSLPQMVVFGIFSFVACVMASLMFNGLKGKTERIEHFMLPATVCEKFMSQVVIYFLGFIVMFFICTQLADLVRYTVLSLIGFNYVPGLINFMDIDTFHFTRFPMDGQELSITVFQWLVISSVLFSFSFYMLGAALWPKLSFLKTFAANYVFEIILGGAILLTINLVGVEETFKYLSNEYSASVVFGVITGCYVLGTIICSVAAYLVYKRKDVIKTSWL